MVACPASHKKQPSPPSDDRQVRLETAEHNRPGIEVDTTSHGVDNGLRLLVDLLLHEMVVLALHDLG